MMNRSHSQTKQSSRQGQGRQRRTGIISCLLAIAIVLGIYFILLEEEEQQKFSNSTTSRNEKNSILKKNFTTTKTSSSISPFLKIPKSNMPSRIFPTWHQEMASSSNDDKNNNTTTIPLPCILNRTEARHNHLFSSKVQESPSDSGLLFIKIEKAGSSTLAGIVGRISELIYKRQAKKGVLRNEFLQTTSELPKGYTHACKCRGMSHKWGFHSQNILFRQDQNVSNPKQSKQRQRQKRFLWSVVRHPEQRLISQYFHFEVSRQNASTSDQDIIKYLTKKKWHNRQMQYLYPFVKQLKTVNEYDDMERRFATYRQLIQQTLETYNLIGTLERLDETLVLLHFIMDLKLSDVIPLSAKRSNREEELDMNGSGQCTTYQKSFISEGVQTFLSNYDQFRRYHEADYMMYDAVNQSMDKTIDNIGRDKFNKALKDFKKLKLFVHQHNCTYINPCLRKGVLRPWNEIHQLCYKGDAGCGHKCLDQLYPE